MANIATMGPGRQIHWSVVAGQAGLHDSGVRQPIAGSLQFLDLIKGPVLNIFDQTRGLS